jgi:hypothetical protein
MTFWSQLGFVFGKFPFVGWSRGWYAEDTENNFKMQNSQQNEQDIEKTIRSAVQMSKLVKENRYDECVLNRWQFEVASLGCEVKSRIYGIVTSRMRYTIQKEI